MIRKIRNWIKARRDIKSFITERERKEAARQRMILLEEHERDLKDQHSRIRKEFKDEVSEVAKEKMREIHKLRKVLRNLKSSADEVAVLAHEFELDLKIVVNSIVRIQHRLGLLEDKAHRHTDKINKQIDKYFPEGIDRESPRNL